MTDSTLAEFIALQAESFKRAGRATLASFPPEKALGHAELEAFLTRKKYAVMSTTRPNGKPLASLILFLVYQQSFWLPSTAGAARLTNLRSQSWASLVISEGEEAEHTAVVLEGPTVIHERESVAAMLNGDLGRLWSERIQQPHDWVASLIELAPHRLLSYRA